MLVLDGKANPPYSKGATMRLFTRIAAAASTPYYWLVQRLVQELVKDTMPKLRYLRVQLEQVRKNDSFLLIAEVSAAVDEWQSAKLMSMIERLDVQNYNRDFDDELEKLRALQNALNKAVSSGVIIFIMVPSRQACMKMQDEMIGAVIDAIDDLEESVSKTQVA